MNRRQRDFVKRNRQSKLGVARRGVLGVVILGMGVLGVSVLGMGTMGWAEEPAAGPKTVPVTAADGKLILEVPATWTQKEPASTMLEFEYVAPPAEGDEAPGRLTLMMAGGSVQANLDRWKAQFRVPPEPAKAPRLGTLQADGQTVHWLDIQGTYLDRRGPFGPATPREDYRMLGAIVELKGGGLFFLKFYGPQKTLEAHASAFRAMLESAKAR